MALDLSKLSALALPEKDIECVILGEKQTVKIRALDDESSIKVMAISADEKMSDGDKQLAIRRIVLEKAVLPELSADEITLLMTKAASSVVQIYIAVSELTREFAETRHNVSEEAKKNLNKTPETGEHV